MSVASSHSGLSNSSRRSGSFGLDDESSEKGRCPIPDCGRVFKDLKAHMLTHQASRPEKCPIPTCEYHTKGFARKYDKNRHTLTHYKGTMVCGFCPGSGSAAEKSFNRADVFKRHLTTIHDVEQTPPNSKRKSPGGKKSTGTSENSSTSGACSTCHLTFPNPQEFYDHLDECVLRIVQQVDPSEGINEKHLTDISQHDDVKETLERNNLSNELDYTVPSYNEVDEDEDEDEDAEADDSFDTASPRGNPRSGKGTIKAGKKGQNSQAHSRDTGGAGNSASRVSKPSSRRAARAGLTWSKGGVKIQGASPPTSSGRRKRKFYPPSWGCNARKMNMKKRVLCVYDGPRRLWKDDMMLNNEFEVRVPLIAGESGVGSRYVTDLDVLTVHKAEAILDASEEEKGEWIPDNVFEGHSDLDELDISL